MAELRLGDVIDDFCVKCRRLTNHSIVSLVNGDPAKVRCRTCYSDHDYRHEQAPPSRKDLKKMELFKEVLAKVEPQAAAPAEAAAAEIVADPEPELSTAGAAASEPADPPAAEPAPKTKARRKRS